MYFFRVFIKKAHFKSFYAFVLWGQGASIFLTLDSDEVKFCLVFENVGRPKKWRIERDEEINLVREVRSELRETTQLLRGQGSRRSRSN